MRRLRAAAVAIFAVALAEPTRAAKKLGVVLIHGKQGTPAQFSSYEAPLAEQGYLSERLEMCWSRQRIYDRPYLDCLADIDAAVERLKERGANAIVVLGMSLGGNAALAYGARHAGLKGVIALAPAHAPEFIARWPAVSASIEKARALVKSGRGKAKTDFADVNAGGPITVTTTPKIYLSFHGSDSAAVMPGNAAKLTAPFLCVAPTDDPPQRGRDYVFAKVPRHAINRYVSVDSDHRGTPAAARETVMNWLKELMGP